MLEDVRDKLRENLKVNDGNPLVISLGSVYSIKHVLNKSDVFIDPSGSETKLCGCRINPT